MTRFEVGIQTGNTQNGIGITTVILTFFFFFLENNLYTEFVSPSQIYMKIYVSYTKSLGEKLKEIDDDIYFYTTSLILDDKYTK